jgi:hypothetical protein
MAAGDTLLVAVWQRCAERMCSGREVPVDSFQWTTQDHDLVSIEPTIGRRRQVGRMAVVAHAPGRARLSARREGDDLAHVITILPPVATLDWEPAEVRLAVGETAIVRAVARDSAGDVVAIVSWSSASHRLPRTGAAVDLRPLEDQSLLVTGLEPGVTCLETRLAHRTAMARIVVTPVSEDAPDHCQH